MRSIIASAEVVVNGQPLHPDKVGYLYQVDPFPGDARYAITLHLRKPLDRRSTIRELGNGIHVNLSHDVARWSLHEIEWLVGSTAAPDTRQVERLDYFINTIERLSLRDDEVLIEGICSTVLRYSENQTNRRYQPKALEALDLPLSTKRTLSDVGLPRMVEPFFVTDADDLDILTLAEWACRVSMLAQGGWDRYYRIGGNQASVICIRKRTGEVMSIDSSGELPDCFVNSSVDQFIRCLHLMNSTDIVAPTDMSEQAVSRRGLQAEASIALIDPEALTNGENFWSQVVDEMKFDLI